MGRIVTRSGTPMNKYFQTARVSLCLHNGQRPVSNTSVTQPLDIIFLFPGFEGSTLIRSVLAALAGESVCGSNS